MEATYIQTTTPCEVIVFACLMFSCGIDSIMPVPVITLLIFLQHFPVTYPVLLVLTHSHKSYKAREGPCPSSVLIAQYSVDEKL